MPKKNNHQENNDKDKAGKKGGKKKGNTYRDIRDKAKKSKKKKVTVNLPALIKPQQNTGQEEETEEAEFYHSEDVESEYEISYKDALLAVEMEKLAAKGLNNDEIIAALKISRDTFYRKLREEPYFSYALHKHRGIALLAVESALHQNAVGFKYTEQQGTAMGDVITVEKQKLPETRAQEIILYNRKREEWKRKPEPALKEADSVSNIQLVIKRRED